MTTLAIGSEAAAMAIVALMAIDALGRGLCRVAGAGVTGRADEALVLSRQRKPGSSVMVEGPDLPVDRVMAIAALRRGTQRAGVVIVLMTGGTFDALGRERLVDVAVGTFCRCMLAEQRKAAQRMIKPHVGLPGIAVVAACAAGAKLARVCIVLGVA